MTGALPKSGDAQATSKLLSVLLELQAPGHAAKRPRLGTAASSKSAMPHNQSAIRDSVQPAPVTTTAVQGTAMRGSSPQPLDPAPGPVATMPDERGRFVISLGLARTLIRSIEASWGVNNLVDRDYSGHDNLASSTRSEGPRDAGPHLFEADISLTPSVGIITTSLLRV